ncbi:hypothetical protein BH23BAC3_BH23BAC3_20720 [soil metagenome]
MEKHKELSRAVLELIVPVQILDCFELQGVEESADSITLILHEHSDRIPAQLQGKDIILDGYCNPIELHSFPQKAKAMFLRLYRRRWRVKSERGKPYSNSYEFAPKGTKATHAFGAFLKGAFGLSSDRFLAARTAFVRSRQ